MGLTGGGRKTVSNGLAPGLCMRRRARERPALRALTTRRRVRTVHPPRFPHDSARRDSVAPVIQAD
jgi:hypothetical protein